MNTYRPNSIRIGSSNEFKQAYKPDFSGKNLTLLKSADTVTFSSKKQSLLNKYNINPEKVGVISDKQIKFDAETKKTLLIKLLEAHEHALKNKELGNFSGAQFTTSYKFKNGDWTKATNIENTRYISHCGERSALTRGWNAILDKLSLDRLIKDPDYKEKAQKGMQVEYMVMTNALELGNTRCGKPCSDCQEWINTARYFNPDVKVITLEGNRQDGFNLKVRTVKDILPYWNEQGPSISEKAIKDLSIETTEKASKISAESNISEAQIRELLEVAKKEYDENVNSSVSGKLKQGAAILMDPGNRIFSDKSFNWPNRWFNYAELDAAKKAFFTLEKEGVPVEDIKIKAIAYYGEQDSPNIANLGKICQPQKTSDIQIITIAEDKIQVRALKDYNPFLFLKKDKKIS